MAYQDFSDTSVEKAGLIQSCEFNIFGDNGYGQISGNASRLAGFTNYLNEGLSTYNMVGLKVLGWNFDDTNFTTVPIATANLVDGQQDYGLATTHIQILSVEIKDSNGNWRLLDEIDEKEFVQRKQSLSAYYDNAGTAIEGTPQEYNLIGTSLFLYPTPSYNSTNGLKVRFQRPPSYFATTDTTKEAGIPETHYTYLSDFATWKYKLARSHNDEPVWRARVEKWERITIPEFFGRRNRVRDNVMRGKKIDFI